MRSLCWRTRHGKNDCPVIPPHVARYEDPTVNAESDENGSERGEGPGDTGQGGIPVYVPARGRGSGIHGAIQFRVVIKPR